MNTKKDHQMPVTIGEMIHFLQAAHLSQRTNWDLKSRGGIMLVAYPEQLKTTLVEVALKPYSEAKILSDLNVRELSNLRQDILSGDYETLAFLDFQKIYERDERVSSNSEGCLRGLIDEGWAGLAEKQGQRVRAFVVACATPGLWDQKHEAWKENGMLRRMLKLRYTFKDKYLLEDSIVKGRRLPLAIQHSIPPLEGAGYQYKVTVNESSYIKASLRDQRGLIPLQLLLRVYNTLKFYFDECLQQKDGAMQLLMNIVPLLGRDGGEMVVKRDAELKIVPPQISGENELLKPKRMARKQA